MHRHHPSAQQARQGDVTSDGEVCVVPVPAVIDRAVHSGDRSNRSVNGNGNDVGVIVPCRLVMVAVPL